MFNVTLTHAYTMSLSEQDIQEQIDAIMPLEKKQLFLTVVMSDAKVSLSESANRLEIASDIALSSGAGVGGSGHATIAGAIRYDAENGAFYIDDPEIVSLESESIPRNFLSETKKYVQLIAEQVLPRYPVYQLDNENLQEQLAKAVLKSVRVEDHKLIVELDML